MSFSPVEDIRPFTDLESEPRTVCDQVRETGRPVFLTSDGKADLVIMDAKTYEYQLKTMNLAKLLAEAEAHISAGRTRPIQEFFDELRRDTNVSS